jgi:hypothetical protein
MRGGELFVLSLPVCLSPLAPRGRGAGGEGLQDSAHSLGQEQPPCWTKLYASLGGKPTRRRPRGLVDAFDGLLTISLVLDRMARHAVHNSEIGDMNSTAPAKFPGGVGFAVLSLFGIPAIAIGLFLWKPWYSREQAARISELRSNVAELKGVSIAAFLKAHPERRNEIPFFVNPPVEYYWLDQFAMYAAGTSCCVWPVFWMLLMGSMARTPTVNAMQTSTEETGNATQTPAVVYTLTCGYCGQSFVTNGLAPGQAVNCPHCAGIVQVPGR